MDTTLTRYQVGTSLLISYVPQLTSQHLRASDIHSEPVATEMHVNNVQRSRELKSSPPGTSSQYGDVTQWLGSNTVPREDLNSLNFHPLLPVLFSLYTYLSCSTNTGGVLLCSTQCIVLSGTGFLYLVVNRQGKIVYDLPYTHICRRSFTA